jgi:hypothetical protein
LLLWAKITYNTRLEKDLIKKFKILALEQDKRQNDILEETIRDVLKKYEPVKNPVNSCRSPEGTVYDKKSNLDHIPITYHLHYFTISSFIQLLCGFRQRSI